MDNMPRPSERPADPGPPIATRMLRVVEDSRTTEVPARLYAPVQEGPRIWYAWSEIDWPDGLHGIRAYGVDAMQALILALNMLGIHVYTSGYHDDGVLVWDAPGQGYGFPVPSGVRDMLVGDDAKFF
jgi:hypothetical protein